MTTAEHLSDTAYRAAAWMLACEEAMIRAVADVEAGAMGAFLPTGEPTILFERHHFSRRTGGRFDGVHAPGLPRSYSLISSPSPGGYGPYSKQHARLQAAAALDREAALSSASWGLFQIMGWNHQRAGHPELQGFINAMFGSAEDHLRAFVNFNESDPVLLDALRRRRFKTYALRFNGRTYWKNRYDNRIEAAYLDKLRLAAA